MIESIAEGLVNISGSFYPIIGPLIGAIGTFVTGSVTSSNILFGKLQAQAAVQMRLGPIEMSKLIAANSVGGTAGKIISPQSIAIATAACNMKDKDDTILRKALPYAIGYILLAGLIVYLGIICN